MVRSQPIPCPDWSEGQVHRVPMATDHTAETSQESVPSLLQELGIVTAPSSGNPGEEPVG